MNPLIASAHRAARSLAWAVLVLSMSEVTPPVQAGSFAEDAAFLRNHTPIVELTDLSGQGRILVAPALQGRVMTSAAAGDNGLSFGWINRELFTSGEQRPHINPYGGEDRLWFGPEGGQFSIFFPPGAPFEFAHWQTPAALDTEPFELAHQTRDAATFVRRMTFTNYSRTVLEVRAERRVQVIEPAQAWKHLGLGAQPGVKLVAYQSVNRLSNAGDQPWTAQGGMLSMWILGMFNASPKTTVVVPYREGAEADLGQAIEAGYFGSIPPERLVVRDGFAFFRADAQFRSKLGVSPRRAKPFMGSYDDANRTLTVVQFTLPPDRRDYVNSLWKHQENPFSGDAANSYNDGPNDTGKSLGNFYEIESSSPAANLAPGQTLEHTHRTIHLTGDPAGLDRVARAALGVSLDDFRAAFKGR